MISMGFILLRVRASGYGKEILGSVKCWEILKYVAERLAISQEGLISSELLIELAS
jgi:hypothetical protein